MARGWTTTRLSDAVVPRVDLIADSSRDIFRILSLHTTEADFGHHKALQLAEQHCLVEESDWLHVRLVQLGQLGHSLGKRCGDLVLQNGNGTYKGE